MKHGLRALIGDTRLPVGPEERPDDLMESSGAISVMRVQLFSQDRGLYRLCREVLSEIAGESWTASIASPEEAADSCDLTLWDFQPELQLPEWIASSPSQHLFLVERKDLTCFRERTGTDGGRILLKPVTRAALAAFLGLASSAHRDGIRATQTLRADRDEILQCLMQANLRLQEYDQDRTTFLARAVHDFRAPLTALSGYCGLLLGEPLGPLTEAQREVLRRMQHSSQRLTRMASAMFELSAGRHVKRRPDLQPGDVNECLEQALHEITPFLDDKSIAVTVDFLPSGEPLYFEAGQLEQVLINVLDNAGRFTPKAGTIELGGYPYFWERRFSRSAVPPGAERRHRARTEPNAYRIDIRDSGEPIPLEHLGRIFEEYTSCGGGKDRSGAGLGLAISRMIVNRHEGRIWAENTDLGPMFCIVLPLRKRAAIRCNESR